MKKGAVRYTKKRTYVRHDRIDISVHGPRVHVDFYWKGELVYSLYEEFRFSLGETLSLTGIKGEIECRMLT